MTCSARHCPNARNLSKSDRTPPSSKSPISPDEFGQYAPPTVPSPRAEDESDDEEDESIFGDDDDDDFLARELEEEMG